MMGSQRIMVYAAIAVVTSVIAYLIPEALASMAFSGELFFGSQELWRLISFPFAHIGTMHLLQNVIAISIITYIGHEIDLRSDIYLGAFLIVSFVTALITGLLLPAMLIAGLSLGIYAIFGSVSVKAANFIPKKVLLPILAIAILLEPLLSLGDSGSMRSSAFHLIGFFGGMGYTFTIRSFKVRKKVLTHD